jgi:uncharacterized beta-barrel protein YwiB (DUF1934 family)
MSYSLVQRRYLFFSIIAIFNIHIQSLFIAIQSYVLAKRVEIRLNCKGVLYIVVKRMNDGRGLMPIPLKHKVIVGFRSRQDNGDLTESVMRGEWHRLTSSWVLTCIETGNETGETMMTLFVQDAELRLRRRGLVSMEQQFRTGMSIPGAYSTSYGPLSAEALTHQLKIEVSETGGVIEWKYDLLIQEQVVGSFHIRLDIQEEQAE